MGLQYPSTKELEAQMLGGNRQAATRKPKNKRYTHPALPNQCAASTRLDEALFSGNDAIGVSTKYATLSVCAYVEAVRSFHPRQRRDLGFHQKYAPLSLPNQCKLDFGVWNLDSDFVRIHGNIWNLEFGIWDLEFGIWSLEFGFRISTSCASTATRRNTRRVHLQTTMIGNVSASPDQTRKGVLGTKRGVALRCVNGGDRNRLLRQNHQADPRFGKWWRKYLEGSAGRQSRIDDRGIDNRSLCDRDGRI